MAQKYNFKKVSIPQSNPWDPNSFDARYVNQHILPSYEYPVVPIGPNFGDPIDYSDTANTGTEGIKNFFSRFGPDKSLLGNKIDLSGLKNLGSNIRNTQLFNGGPTLGGMANIGMGVYQGANAVKGLGENIASSNDFKDLKDSITAEIASNPMYDMYMDASDEKLLRQMKNGSLDDNWSEAATGAVKGIPQAALTALIGGLLGGPAGAAIGGFGSLANSGIQGFGEGTEQTNAQLQGLYDKLRRANEDYRSMKRPSGLRQAGLQSQYFNQLY